MYHKQLETGETVNTARYQQQMIYLSRVSTNNHKNYSKSQHPVILPHDNAPAHKAKWTCDTYEAFEWEAYSPDLAPSDFFVFLFRSMALGLTEQSTIAMSANVRL